MCWQLGEREVVAPICFTCMVGFRGVYIVYGGMILGYPFIVVEDGLPVWYGVPHTPPRFSTGR